jgi:hypothetical protein
MGLYINRPTEGKHDPTHGLVAKMPERVAEIFAKELNQWSLSPEQEATVCEAIKHRACEANPDAVNKFIQDALGGSAAAEKPEPVTKEFGMVQYPLEQAEGDRGYGGGARITDFPWSSSLILPREDIGESSRAEISRLKPDAAGKKLRSDLDDLARTCFIYDQARQKGLKAPDPNYPPDPPHGHGNLLQSLGLRESQISFAKKFVLDLLQAKPFLAGDLLPADRDLLTVPDTEESGEDMSGKTITFEGVYSRPLSGEERDEEPEEEHDMSMSVSVNRGESVTFTNADVKTLREAAEHLRSLEDAIPDECSAKVPMSGKALKVILTAAAAKPGKNDPAAPIHSVGIGKHSICATDQKKAVIVGEVEEIYESTVRTEALVEASSADLRGEWVSFDQIERLGPPNPTDPAPPFPPIGKVVSQLDGMVEVGTFNPSLLKQVAMVAESLGTSKVTLFRAQGSGVASMLGFKGEYWPFEQLELFSAIESPVPFIGILAGTEKRHGDDEEKE